MALTAKQASTVAAALGLTLQGAAMSGFTSAVSNHFNTPKEAVAALQEPGSLSKATRDSLRSDMPRQVAQYIFS